MKTAITLFSIFMCLTILIQVSDAQEEKSNYHKWWEDGYWRKPKENPQAKSLPLIKVSGNCFTNASGDTVFFRGLSISDPDKLENQGLWNKNHFENVKNMGAKIVRIPIHPVAWRERTPEKYLELLDQAVSWCTELKMYVILDWHSIGNLRMELFQQPMYDTSQKETFQFWRTIAGHFRGHNTVAFYELFNEPTVFRGLLGNMSWREWKEIVEDIIRLVRAYDRETIPLVAGFDWAYDLNNLHYDPVNADDIAYVTHPYAKKRSRPWEPKWEENFGFAANKYPVFATEIGFRLLEDKAVGKDDYGQRIVRYLEGRGISWCAWVYDAEWYPRMLKSFDDYELTGYGKFIKKTLHEKIKK